jgi:predicted small lipoprotein YifL
MAMAAGKFAVLMAAVAVALAGCGQKGPLYLPDKGGEVVTRPGGGQAQQPAPPGTQTQPAGTATQPSDTDSEQKKKDAQPPRN